MGRHAGRTVASGEREIAVPAKRGKEETERMGVRK
jgi:hypothetical protein